MRLTTFSDYALRVLLYAANAGDRLITIDETAKVYGVSRAHLMKVVNVLTRAGYLKAVRGRSGGLLLARSPEKIRLGDIIRLSEPDFTLVECFSIGNECILTRCCGLPRVVNEALNAFISTFDRYTLADIALKGRDFLPPHGKKLGTRGPHFARPRASH
ncbi:MAG: Rrf2 family transcriptional regulator [Pseudorhodoplanes sp.]|nr:Rrf2 family transcriptional regulator [Pseudorhodoplanes sp.]